MSLAPALVVFLVTAAVVVRAGTALAAAGDHIAKRTGLGRLLEVVPGFVEVEVGVLHREPA